ncbi:sugar transferase [Blastomonas sp.]|uniref:sugar transferase n=1 Tax=Blastomonas sp. TaxID=1909299 RepID=UPI00260ACC3F|nr:sugar transferase [Blastomonas sp.]MDM7957521.1 sugar transferase [Blastomonas sp.]
MARQAQQSTIGISPIRSLRVQTIAALALAVLLPGIVYFNDNPFQIINSTTAFNTLVGAGVATFVAYFMASRVTAFPGTSQLSYVLPTYVVSYGVIATVILLTRLPYSASILTINFVATMSVQILASILAERQVPYEVHIVPGGRISQIGSVRHLPTIALSTPAVPAGKRAILVADLHYDHSNEWERAIAEATLRGIPVYHYKQVIESLTGRVRIEHMSENMFGSLLPSLNYARTKRAADVLVTLLLIPLLALPMLLVGIAIRMESSGPALFRQARMGYGGKPFSVVKFRTMRCPDPNQPTDARDAAMTKKDDDRITPLGRFLRRSRIDELPQFINVLKGEMSWIGPRPEAIALSEWYESELPFYSYRHIVRPGITGWAQVNQGHVTNLDDISAKLQYDFYYIKNFSYWLDLLIVFRTVMVMLNGFGAK